MAQGPYQPLKMTTYNAEDATKTFMTPSEQMVTPVASIWRDNMPLGESSGTVPVAGAHGPSHFVNVTPPTSTAPLENLIRWVVPSSGISSGLGEDAGTGPVADTSTSGLQASGLPALRIQPHVNMYSLGAQPLATLPQHVFPHGSGIEQRQQLEYAQTLIAGGLGFRANRTADPITPGAFMTPSQQMVTGNILWGESPGTVAGAHGPSHLVNVTSLTAPLENLIRWVVPPSGIYSGLGEEAGTGPVADTSTSGLQASGPPALQTHPHVNMIPMFAPGVQPLAMQTQPVFHHGSGIEQRQQSMPLEDAQTLNSGGSVLGANRTADPITPGAFGGIVGDSWTGTLCWQYHRNGDRYQAQGVATDGIRNLCVYSSVRCKRIENSHPRRMFSIWPRILKILLVKTAVSTSDIQAWILKNRTPVARIKGKPGSRHQFDDLVKSLRSGGSVSRRCRSTTYPLTL